MSVTAPRVLFVTGEYPPHPGGIADYTVNLRLALAGIGVGSRVLTRGVAPERDIEVVDRWGWDISHQVRERANGAGVDVVHIQYQAGAFDMHPAINLLPSRLRSSGTPVVVTFHDLRPPYLFPKAGRLRQAAVLRMARHATAAIVTNLADERGLDDAGIRTRRIAIGPNLPPPAGSVCVDPDTVAFFGFPARSKGIEDVIVALGGIADRQRPRLLLIGDQGRPSRNNDIVSVQAIDDLAARHGVRVERTGYLSPQGASDALASAGVIVLPFQSGASLRSGSLLAALQSGRPVVTTRPARPDDLGELSALPQMSLAPPGEPSRLANEVLSALDSSRGAAPLPEEFRWQTIARQHRDLYRELVAQAGA